MRSNSEACEPRLDNIGPKMAQTLVSQYSVLRSQFITPIMVGTAMI